MVVRANTFDGHTDEALIDEINSGTSGDAFDLEAGECFYDTDIVAHGDCSARCGDGIVSSFLEWSGLGSWTTLTGRIYLLMPSLPAGSDVRVVQIRNAASSTVADISIKSTGAVELNGAAKMGETTATISAGSWCRIEWNITAAGDGELRLFLSPDSTTPNQTLTGTQTFGSDFDLVRLGNTNLTEIVQLDEVEINDTGTFIGPAIVAEDIVAPTVTVDEIHGAGSADDISQSDGYNAKTGILTITGTASDETSLDRVEVSVDESFPAAATGTTTWSIAVDTSNWAAGVHTVEAIAYDQANNPSEVVNILVWHSPDHMYGAAENPGDHLVPLLAQSWEDQG